MVVEHSAASIVFILGEPCHYQALREDFLLLGIVKTLSLTDFHATPSRIIYPGVLEKIMQRYIDDYQHRYKLLYIHPGMTPWYFAHRLRSYIMNYACVRWIGVLPSVEAIFANPLKFFWHVSHLNIPVTPYHLTPVSSGREIQQIVQEYALEYPIVLRALASVSVQSVLLLTHELSLERDFPSWLEYLKFFHDDGLFLVERYIPDARCIIAPFVRFADGTIQYFSFIDASLQSRFRKILQFCPAHNLDAYDQERIYHRVAQVADALQFVGVGSFEFLLDSSELYLLGGLARLDTHYELWQRAGATLAIAWQLAVLGMINASDIPYQKPADDLVLAAFRIYAEDAYFLLPQIGVVHELQIPSHGLISESSSQGWFRPNVSIGQRLQVLDSCVLGFLYVCSHNYQKILAMGRFFFSNVRIRGSLQTNLHYLMDIVEHLWIKEKVFSYGFLDYHMSSASVAHEDLEMVAHIVHWWDSDGSGKPFGRQYPMMVEMKKKFLSPFKELPSDSFQTVEQTQSSWVGWMHHPEQGSIDVSIYVMPSERWYFVHMGYQSFNVRKEVLIEVLTDTTYEITAFMSGMVHGPYFVENDVLEAGQVLLSIHILGFYMPHRVPRRLRVKKIYTKPFAKVIAGDVLVGLSTENLQDGSPMIAAPHERRPL